MSQLDKAISVYRKAADAHGKATAEFVRAHAAVTASQRALMFAKDDLREAERAAREADVPTINQLV